MKLHASCRRYLLSDLYHVSVFVFPLFFAGLWAAHAGADDKQDQAAARAYNAAAALQNNGLHERAATKWAEFVKAYPNDQRADRAHYYMGVCQLRTKKFADAATNFQTVLSKWPKFAQADGAQYNLSMALYELALVSKKKEDFQKAAAAFQTVATKYPKSDYADDALYFQGDCAYAIEDRQTAVAAFQKLIAQYPQSRQLARAYYDLGITQQELELPAEAAKTFKAFLDKQEFTKHELANEVRLRWAMCLHDQGQADTAAAQFEQLANAKDFPFADFALLRLGQAKLEASKWLEAAQTLAVMPQRFPQSPYKNEALKTAGRAYYEAGKLPEAEATLKPLAGGTDAIAAEASYWLGRTQLKKNDAAAALQTLEAAGNRFKAGEFVPYLRLARIDALYEITDRRQETPPLYEAFIKEFPQHPLVTQATYMAALGALGTEQLAKARQFSEALLKTPEFAQHPLHPAVLYIAAESQLLESPNDAATGARAEPLYRQLVSKYPQHANAGRAHLRIGWILHTAKKYAESTAYLKGIVGNLDKSEQQPEAQLMIGRNYAAENKHPEATAAFEVALAANAKWNRADEVLLNAAQSYRSRQDLKSATDRLHRLVQEFAESPLRGQALYLLGDLAQSQNQHDAAIKAYTQVAQQGAEGAYYQPALYGLGAVYFSQEKYPESKTWLDKVVAGGDEKLKQRGHYLRGLVQHRLKQYAPALVDLNAFLSSKPESEEALNARYTLALCHIGQKQFTEASQALTQLLQAKADYVHADKVYYELGHALLAQPDKEAEAAEQFRRLAETLPNSPLAAESWFRVGQFHRELAQEQPEEQRQPHFEKARTAFTQGLTKAKPPELREKLQFKLGETQFLEGQYAPAAAAFAAQIKEHSKGQYVGVARFLAGQSYYQLKQFDQALPLFVQVPQDTFAGIDKAQADEHRAQALYRAGACAAELGNWKESETRYAQLITQFAKFPQINEARYGLAFAAQQQQQIDSALKIYEEITKQTETETAAKARFMIGEIRFGQMKYEEAIEHFLLVSVGYPYAEWQALARFEAGRCFVELKDVDRAVKSLREMIDKHPEHPRTKDAEKMLNDLTK